MDFKLLSTVNPWTTDSLQNVALNLCYSMLFICFSYCFISANAKDYTAEWGNWGIGWKASKLLSKRSNWVGWNQRRLLFLRMKLQWPVYCNWTTCNDLLFVIQLEAFNIVYTLGYIKEVTSTDLAIVLEYVPLGDLRNMLRKWKELVRLAFTCFVCIH